MIVLKLIFTTFDFRDHHLIKNASTPLSVTPLILLFILTMPCRTESKPIFLFKNYFKLFKALSSFGSITLISSTANPPTEARNQGSDFSSPKAENGTKATPASLIR